MNGPNGAQQLSEHPYRDLYIDCYEDNYMGLHNIFLPGEFRSTLLDVKRSIDIDWVHTRGMVTWVLLARHRQKSKQEGEDAYNRGQF